MYYLYMLLLKWDRIKKGAGNGIRDKRWTQNKSWGEKVRCGINKIGI